MKSILLAVVAVFAMSATQNAEAKQIVIDGQQSQIREFLNGEVSHTEYRTEYRQTTCSREVFDGYEQRCYYQGGGRQCRTVDGGQSCGITPTGRQCTDLPDRTECYDTPGRQVCENYPRYRTEYYTCTQPVQVPYQVKDYDVEHDVTFNIERSRIRGLQEVVDLSVMTNGSLSITAPRTTGKALISATQSTQEVSNNGRVRRFVTTVNVKLIDRYAAVGPFTAPISDLTGDINELQITTGRITDLSLLRIEIIAKKNRLIGDDPVVIQKVLDSSDMALVNNNNGTTTIKINFNKLGGPDKLNGKRAKIDVIIEALLPLENILNRQDMPAETRVSKNLRADF